MTLGLGLLGFGIYGIFQHKEKILEYLLGLGILRYLKKKVSFSREEKINNSKDKYFEKMREKLSEYSEKAGMESLKSRYMSQKFLFEKYGESNMEYQSYLTDKWNAFQLITQKENLHEKDIIFPSGFREFQNLYNTLCLQRGEYIASMCYTLSNPTPYLLPSNKMGNMMMQQENIKKAYQNLRNRIKRFIHAPLRL